MNPLLAVDVVESKLRFPLIAQPKIDGVRAVNFDCTLTGRSLKPFGNRYVSNLFSREELIGLDGEMAAEADTHPDLCRITSSALSTHTGEPYTVWWLFDYVFGDLYLAPYAERYQALFHRVAELKALNEEPFPRLRIVPSVTCETLEQLNAADEAYLDAGYEGTIVRDPTSLFKSGRSTLRGMELLRIKRFLDGEFVITELIEGESNLNPAQINELGLQYRSTHKENKVPNGMLGTFVGTVLADITCNGDTLFKEGEQIVVSAGKMGHDDRKKAIADPASYLGQIGKFKFFPKGIKDKPRFPTFQSLREPFDL